MSRALITLARLVAILGIGLISVFALDVFGTGAPLASVLVGLGIHLLPSFALAAVLALAWRRPAAGGVLFLAAGLSPLFLLSNPLWTNLLLGGPFLVAGLSFLAGAGWKLPAGRREAPPA